MEPLARTASAEPDQTPVPERDEGVLRISLLGRFEVSVGSRVVGEQAWRLRKAAVLVKLLALAPYHRLHRERAMDLLWPELAPRSAANNLHQTLHAARRTLEPGAAGFRYLVLRDELLYLCPDGALYVDVDAFEETAAEARRSGRPASYQKAIELYAGDLLPRDRYEEWAEERREGLRRTHLALLSELAALYEARGAHDRAIEVLQRVVAATARFFGGSDTTPPKVGPPEESLVANSALGGSNAVPVRLSWSATDAEGEVTGYALQRSTDGAPYEDVGLADATATTGTLGLEPGHDHRFRVRATDDNGNRSVWKYGPRFALVAPQENDPSVLYARTWKTETLASASGGEVRYATTKGAKATLSFTGTEVAWVAPKSKTRGKATVFLDGARVATVDLFSAKTRTPGRPRVDVDAFVVLR